MKYVFYNLRNLAKNEKIIFAVMLVCIFSSAWIMTFSYGLYQNYSCLKIESDGESKDIVPEISAGQTLTYGDAKTYLDALPDDVISVANVIYCISSYHYSSTDETASVPVFSRFTVSGGVYRPSPYIAEIWENEGIIASANTFPTATRLRASRPYW